MTRLIKMMLCPALIAILFVSFSLVTAQTPAPTPAPIDTANLAVISAINLGQLKSLGSLSVNQFYGFSPDSKTLFYEDPDGKLNAWDLAAGKVSSTIPTTRGQKYLSADTKTLMVLNGSMIETWDIASAQKTNSVQVDQPPAQFRSPVFSALGKFMAYVDSDIYPNPPYTLYDTATGKVLFTFPTSRNIDGNSTFTPDDKAVLVSGLRGDMQFMDTTSGKILWRFHSDNVNGGKILISPDGHMLAIVGPFGATDLIDTTSGKAVKIPGDDAGQNYNNRAAFSSDSQKLWLLSDTNAATAYDLTGKVVATTEVNAQDVRYSSEIRFNADGSPDALHLDLNLLGIADMPFYVTWLSPDGKLLAVFLNLNTIELWGVAG